MLKDNLLSLRKMKNLSQEALAEQLGVARQTLSKWETGESLPDLEKARQLAELLDVSLDDLISTPVIPGIPGTPPKGKHVFGLVTVGDKGQIVLPAKSRRLFDIQAGDRLLVLGDENSGIALLKEKDFLALLGGLHAASD